MQFLKKFVEHKLAFELRSREPSWDGGGIVGLRWFHMKLFTQIPDNSSRRADAMYNFVQLVLSVYVGSKHVESPRTNSSPLRTLEMDLYWYITFSRLLTPSRVSGNHSYYAWEQFGVYCFAKDTLTTVKGQTILQWVDDCSSSWAAANPQIKDYEQSKGWLCLCCVWNCSTCIVKKICLQCVLFESTEILSKAYCYGTLRFVYEAKQRKTS